VIDALVSAALERLRGDIAAANVQGSVEGLLAKHFVGDDARLGFDWMVDCDGTWLESHYDPTRLPSVAALAFTVSRGGTEAMLASLDKGLARAVSRDATAASQNVVLHSPPVLVGLVLAANLFRERAPHYLSWCREVIRALKTSSSGSADALVEYAATLAGLEVLAITESGDGSAFDLAAREWLLSLPGAEPKGQERRKALRHALVEQVLSEEIGTRAAHEAALIWRAVHSAISEATSDLLRSPATVVHILEQFEASMRRWRWDAFNLKVPIQWPVVGEREVQDILYLMLRPVFLDLEDEDTLPKFGHSTYRADFGIPSLGLLIEVKYARSASDFRDIEKEVLEDIVPYLQTPERYSQIVIFVYDHSASVQVHETTARALRRAPGIAGVVIASRPSHLPSERPAEGHAMAPRPAPQKRVRKTPKPAGG
jgi:hypothetical protein